MDNSIGNEKTILPGSPSGGHAYALKPGDTLGQYKVIKPLGAGGMGEVYEVEHQVLGRRYALKLLPATLDWMGVSLERFRREAKVMANLDHPNILKVDDFGETDGRYWLRMELIDGIQIEQKQTKETKKEIIVSLQDLSDAHGGKIPQDVLLAILKQILEGLDYAHKRGAIHRDLKPSNILLAPPPPNTQHPIPNTHYPTPKIADFGLVKLVGEDWVRSQAQLSVQRSMADSIIDAKTQHQIPNTKYPTPNAQNPEGTSTRALLGTFEYMSPEQKRGEEADARSDLYAVGLMAYRLLTGRSNVLKLPSRIDTTLALGWDDFVEQALEEDKEDRLSGADLGLRLLGEIEGDLAKRGQTGREKAAAEDRRLAREELARRETEAKERRAAEEAAEAARRQELEAIRRKDEERKRGKLPAFTSFIVVPPVVSEQSKPSNGVQVDLGAGVTLNLVWIPSGKFTMGSPKNEPERFNDEGPQHEITISKGFWMGKTAVTQKQYAQLMEINPSHFKKAGPDAPVEMVTWHDATNFTGKLQARLHGELQGKKAGLPTEAEWEYGCRAGTTTPFYTGRCLDASQANYNGNYPLDGCSKGANRQTTIKVGSFPANNWGLHDMHGDVWEWCQDGKRTYRQAAETDPGINDTSGSSRVLRGGSWISGARFCRSARRDDIAPGYQDSFIGFRVVVR